MRKYIVKARLFKFALKLVLIVKVENVCSVDDTSSIVNTMQEYVLFEIFSRALCSVNNHSMCL